MTLRVFSYGGGVQSTAALVLAARGVIDFPTFLFCNVGDDSEHPATLDYVRDIAMPYGASHGIDVQELHRTKRDGTTETLMGRLKTAESRSVDIPIRLSNGSPGNRACTGDFKIKVVSKWLKAHGATKDDPAVLAIGISTDEAHRMSNRRPNAREVTAYPLVDLGMDRSACAELIRKEGLPVPRKSACFFCPFHTINTWKEMRRDEPDLWDKTVELETLLNERRAMLGKDTVYFNSRCVPLVQLTEAQTPLFHGEGVETCDAFSCMT